MNEENREKLIALLNAEIERAWGLNSKRIVDSEKLFKEKSQVFMEGLEFHGYRLRNPLLEALEKTHLAEDVKSAIALLIKKWLSSGPPSEQEIHSTAFWAHGAIFIRTDSGNDVLQACLCESIITQFLGEVAPDALEAAFSKHEGSREDAINVFAATLDHDIFKVLEAAAQGFGKVLRERIMTSVVTAFQEAAFKGLEAALSDLKIEWLSLSPARKVSLKVTNTIDRERFSPQTRGNKTTPKRLLEEALEVAREQVIARGEKWNKKNAIEKLKKMDTVKISDHKSLNSNLKNHGLGDWFKKSS